MIWKLFAVFYASAGVDVLLHRIGLSVKMPSRRAAEHDGQRIDR